MIMALNLLHNHNHYPNSMMNDRGLCGDFYN